MDELIYLVKCAILSEKPERIPEDIQGLYIQAKRHNVEALVYSALMGAADAEKLKIFEKSVSIALAMDANQSYYLDIISKKLEENKIRFAVMKGFVIKPLYPSPELRHSADIDIFIDDENTDRVKDIMTELGFTVERFSHSIQDDAYSVGKFVHVEIHRTLISNKCPWDKACQKITDRLIKADGCEYSCEMSCEDFYLYMIGHMAKHMKYSGMGIKMVVDVWLYLRKYADELDAPLLEKRLKEAGLYEFNKNMVKLVDYWFENKPADKKIKVLSEYIISSGNFGTYEQFVNTEIGDKNNIKAARVTEFLKAIFLPYRFMCTKYPVLEKASILLPFFWIYRGVTAVLFRQDNVKSIKDRHKNVDEDYAKRVAEFKKSIGL